MENKFEWKFTDIYKTKEDYKEDIKKVKEKLEEIVQYKGKLKNSSENIYKCYKIFEEIVEMDCKIYASESGSNRRTHIHKSFVS